MNHREEEFLSSLPLRAPSENLDARMEKLLAVPRAEAGGWRRPRVSVWQCAAACAAVAALALFLARGWQPDSQPPTEVHYIVHVENAPYDVFDWTRYPANAAPLGAQSKPYDVVRTSDSI